MARRLTGAVRVVALALGVFSAVSVVMGLPLPGVPSPVSRLLVSAVANATMPQDDVRWPLAGSVDPRDMDKPMKALEDWGIPAGGGCSLLCGINVPPFYRSAAGAS